MRQNKAGDAVAYVGCSSPDITAKNLLLNARHPRGLWQRSRPRSSTPVCGSTQETGDRVTAYRDNTAKGRAGFAVDRWPFC